MSDRISNTYEETFFIVPSHILNLPGLTLGFLKVYQAIFQFWNKGRDCWISTKNICEKTNLEERQVYNALNYLEKNKVIERAYSKGKRYFKPVYSRVEIEDSSKEEQICTPVQGVHSSAVRGCTPVHTIEIKNINKETTHTHTRAREETLEDSLFENQNQKIQAIKSRDRCKNNQKCIDKYESLPAEIRKEKKFDEVIDECVAHYATCSPPKVINVQRLCGWMTSELTHYENHKSKSVNASNSNHKSGKRRWTMQEVMGA